MLYIKKRLKDNMVQFIFLYPGNPSAASPWLFPSYMQGSRRDKWRKQWDLQVSFRLHHYGHRHHYHPHCHLDYRRPQNTTQRIFSVKGGGRGYPLNSLGKIPQKSRYFRSKNSIFCHFSYIFSPSWSIIWPLRSIFNLFNTKSSFLAFLGFFFRKSLADFL